VGVSHHVARFQLERLADAGLLDVEFRRPQGRGGPGAGHPTKLYRAAARQFSFNLPARCYQLAGLITSRALARSMEAGASVDDALDHAAAEAGRAMADAVQGKRKRRVSQRAALDAAIECLEHHGFRPRAVAGGYVLTNCPFEDLARDTPEVVCRMTLSLVSAHLDALGVRTVGTSLDPASDRCCVTLQRV